MSEKSRNFVVLMRENFCSSAVEKLLERAATNSTAHWKKRPQRQTELVKHFSQLKNRVSNYGNQD